MKHANSKEEQFKLVWFVGIMLVFGIGVALAATAKNSAEIINDVRVEANSGGNSGATINQGSASVEVEIHQSVNGVELPPIQISTSSESGESKKIEFHLENASGSAKTEINVNASVNQNNSGERGATTSREISQDKELKKQNKDRPQLETKIETKTENLRALSKDASRVQSFLYSFSQLINDFREKLYNYVLRFF